MFVLKAGAASLLGSHLLRVAAVPLLVVLGLSTLTPKSAAQPAGSSVQSDQENRGPNAQFLPAVAANTELGSEAAPSEVEIASHGRSVHVGFFYGPPRDGTSIATIASKTSFVVASSTKFRDDLRSKGFSGPILRYLLGYEAEGPGPYKNSSASCNRSYEPLSNQAALNTGDFCKYIHPNESWFLHNGSGERIYNEWFEGRVTYMMNPASSGWRSFMRSRINTIQSGFSGVMLDNIELNRNKVRTRLANSDGTVREFSTDDAYRNAIAGYLGYLKEADGALWVNLLNDRLSGSDWDLYLPKVDGVMQEAWASGYQPLTATQWEANIRQAEKALAQGKGTMLVSQGAKDDTARQRFSLASYLLITNNQRTYFRYSKSGSYGNWWDYSNYTTQLGTPKGARYKSGSVWRRDWSCGYVTVDPAARTSKIVTTCN